MKIVKKKKKQNNAKEGALSLTSIFLHLFLGCSQAYGVEDSVVIPDAKLSASSISNQNNSDWPIRGRLNHNGGTQGWGPYRHPVHGFEENWFQVIISFFFIFCEIKIYCQTESVKRLKDTEKTGIAHPSSFGS